VLFLASMSFNVSTLVLVFMN